MTSDITKTEVQLEYYHWLIHTGKLFFTSDIVTTGGAADTNYLIITGNLPVHITSTLVAGAATTFKLIENPTVTVNGTAVTPVNHNRLSTNTMLASGYKGCTYTGGTILKQNQSGFGTNPGQASSSETGEVLEYILKPNTPYVILISTLSATTFVAISELYELALS